MDKKPVIQAKVANPQSVKAKLPVWVWYAAGGSLLATAVIVIVAGVVVASKSKKAAGSGSVVESVESTAKEIRRRNIELENLNNALAFPQKKKEYTDFLASFVGKKIEWDIPYQSVAYDKKSDQYYSQSVFAIRFGIRDGDTWQITLSSKDRGFLFFPNHPSLIQLRTGDHVIVTGTILEMKDSMEGYTTIGTVVTLENPTVRKR